MPNAFNFYASPFDCLSPDEQRLVRNSVDVAYYPQGAVIFDVGAVPTHLMVIIKGYVTQFDGDEVVAVYRADDCFDGRGLVAGRVSSRFVATEELIAYALAGDAVSTLIASNATFGALLFSDLSQKLSAVAQRRARHEWQSLTLSRVDEAFVRPAQVVDAQTDMVSVVRLLRAERVSSVLVRDARSDPPRLGIFTNTSLQRAILDGRPLDVLPVGDLANFSLISVAVSDLLGDAMALMLRQRVHRVVVTDGERVVGVLEALDLFSFLANQSHVITVEIEAARDLDGLRQAASRITRMIVLLQRSGTRVNLIAKLVQQLNERLFESAWTLIAPESLRANSCLFVMGSEGRGEQLLKTDQDNGLILRDGYAPPDDLEAICQHFSDALSSFGYPPCPGGIMVCNPQWRKRAGEFGRMIREWLVLPGGDDLMHLAIFLDAHAVCGDTALLDGVRRDLITWAVDSDALLSRFAAAIDSFGNRHGWWNRLMGLVGEQDQVLNLKKVALFPLVHGVRSLALAHRVLETGTEARIAALVAQGVLQADMGGALTDSLHFFMGLRLKAGLAEIDVERPVTGAVLMTQLSSLDRDLLKDTLEVVTRFQALLRHRFRLDVL